MVGPYKIISDAIVEMDDNSIPVALQKMTNKIEKSGTNLPIGYGSGQAA